ncbi:MAG: glycosyltransferase family 2 protein [Coprococcus phoceensis]
MGKRITVFTPTYNRAHLLHTCYESLLRQTNQEFKWLVIDDGSTDNTKAVVEKWKKEENIEIEYVYKENGGLHTGYNAAIERLDTELSICIDSDDWMPDNAIERILDIWDKNKADDIAGLIGLDYSAEGEIIGDVLHNGELINPIQLLASKNNRGDKKYVVRTSAYKEVAPMPVFEGEKNFNPHYMILKLSAKYKFLAVNEPLCIVDYQDDGMSANIFKQYLNSPKSFAELRRVIMTLPEVPLKYLCKTTLHYISSNRIAGNKGYLKQSPKKIMTILLWIPGYILSKYVEKNGNKILKMK